MTILTAEELAGVSGRLPDEAGISSGLDAMGIPPGGAELAAFNSAGGVVPGMLAGAGAIERVVSRPPRALTKSGSPDSGSSPVVAAASRANRGIAAASRANSGIAASRGDRGIAASRSNKRAAAQPGAPAGTAQRLARRLAERHDALAASLPRDAHQARGKSTSSRSSPAASETRRPVA